jgi:hypothetical protein
MKHFLLSALVFIATFAMGQKMESYKASNGVTYQKGDTIKLGRGSAPNQSFQYIQIGGLAMDINNPDNNNLPRSYSGGNVILKKIAAGKIKGATKIWFIVGAGNIANYYLSIEDAIATCEIVDCKEPDPIVVQVSTPSESRLDKLKKLKELLDIGALTQEEYDKEKAKILEEK